MEVQRVIEDGDVTWVEVMWPETTPEWRIRLAFGAIRGRVRCVGTTVLALDSAQPFSASRLRKLPLAFMIDEVLYDPPRELIRLAGLPAFNTLADLRAAGLSILREKQEDNPGGRGRPVKYGPDHYAEVARIYADHPRKPTQAVAEEFEVKRTTAANWVRKARELGFLEAPRGLSIRGD